MTRSFADLGRGGDLRFGAWHRPPWADSLLARRLLALGLVLAAAVLFLRGDPGARRTSVVVAGRDLAPGHILEADDLRAAPREASALPDGVVRDPSTLLGATLTGAMRGGEIFTDLRVVGSRLAAVASGARDARIVPIRPADTAVAEILRAGDRVDVVGGEEQGSRPARTLATDAAVVLVSGPGDGRAAKERVVLVAMDAEHAAAVAAASLQTALTVVFH
ncbi:Flp pilus assembly protein CpaB [Nocardia tenerifensis]|uniref:Flp pilus assembly protein CpaB n=1 Tax=Nocardia tenerifensis TaxID=228006 RepID=A0A318KUT9_9NOCA|nr:SAF domain-containing protein [Nocardia tenerifensis]PXX68511.1 Flp pilus assembly protein CpaB [Nocardia tenerifensis]